MAKTTVKKPQIHHSEKLCNECVVARDFTHLVAQSQVRDAVMNRFTCFIPITVRLP
jgi:hypothetical protein